MRSLQFKDVFTLSRIIKKMGIKPEMKAGMSQDELGAELIFKFVENIGEVEEEFTSFLADLKCIDKERMKTLSFEELIELINEFKELPGINGFFMQVAKLMK